MKKDSEFCFSFPWQEHRHSNIPSAWLCVYYIILAKSSWRTFSQHLPFQSMNSNTKVGCERCSRLIKKTLARRKSIVVTHFVRFEQALHLVWVLLWPFLKSKQRSSAVLAVFQCWYHHIFIMQPTAPLQRTADKATSKNLKFYFLENNRVQWGLTEKFILAFSTTFA